MDETPRDGVDVLLVEDNPGDVRLAEEGFGASSHDVTIHVVSDGGRALDFVYRRDEYADAPRPDLVMLDLNVPRVSGEEILEELKGDPELRPIPVVVFTSSKSEEDVLGAYRRHANVCISKPVDPSEYIETMGRIVDLWFELGWTPTKHVQKRPAR